MSATLTIDVEPDCPPYLSTWRGIEEGLPRLLDLLDSHAIRATCFVTGETARRHPGAVADIVSRGHELGCHGDRHRFLPSLAPEEARDEIACATAALQPFGEVASFRAPHLRLPRGLLPFLRDLGYRVDSSVGRHKEWGAAVEEVDSIVRIPASIASSTLRWPALARDPLLKRLRDPVVLLVHPWEFVDLRQERLRLDCRVRTGEAALACLATALTLFRARAVAFETLSAVAARHAG